MLEIVTMNIAGIKGNKLYLKELLGANSILCLQEHWLHGYESTKIKEIMPEHDYHISCFDDTLIDLDLHRKRVRKLEKGERIVEVEIQFEPVKIVLINNYMPTMATGSEKEYREHLDKLNSMIEKYEQTHNVFITGDLNGTLMPNRNNYHDKLLKDFYSTCTSQGKNQSDRETKQYKQLNWQGEYYFEMGRNKHRKLPKKNNQVRQKPEMQNETDVQQQAINIIDILQEARKMSVVKKIVSLKGPKWKASPKVKECIEKNKKAFYTWKQKDRAKNTENLECREMKKNKRELRNQIRKEHHTVNKQNFFNNLMDKPD
ncbi:unnamed protein product [Mytilus coruscus]|uniref:Endonuclease/exonuclease/phosphatase domain-containing protein n=1 Tax=Mytilus coruscus TaxID=42192 RepID=A0A6J8DCD7_MYTCO|nr:unnamed protein product [Mytilus coruscus]